MDRRPTGESRQGLQKGTWGGLTSPLYISVMTKLGKSGLSCVLCKVDNLSGVKLYDMLGAICDKCDESGRADKVKNRLVKMYKAKSIESYPDDMDARDFDRIALQASLTYLSFDKFREKMREVDVNPLMYLSLIHI